MSPYVSNKQSRFMHARHPDIAARWDKEYGGKIKKKTKKKDEPTGIRTSRPGRNPNFNPKDYNPRYGVPILGTSTSRHMFSSRFFPDGEPRFNVPPNSMASADTTVPTRFDTIESKVKNSSKGDLPDDLPKDYKFIEEYAGTDYGGFNDISNPKNIPVPGAKPRDYYKRTIVPVEVSAADRKKIDDYLKTQGKIGPLKRVTHLQEDKNPEDIYYGDKYARDDYLDPTPPKNIGVKDVIKEIPHTVKRIPGELFNRLKSLKKKDMNMLDPRKEAPKPSLLNGYNKGYYDKVAKVRNQQLDARYAFRNARLAKAARNKKKATIMVNNKTDAYGQMDPKTNAIEINVKKHKGDKTELANTIHHELLHVKYPNMGEKEIKNKADRETMEMTPAEKQKLIAKVRNKKIHYKQGAMRRKFKMKPSEGKEPGSFIRKANEAKLSKRDIAIRGLI